MSSAKQNGFAGRPVQVLVIGAGARGEIYSRYALAHPDLMQVVAVAEVGAEAIGRRVGRIARAGLAEPGQQVAIEFDGRVEHGGGLGRKPGGIRRGRRRLHFCEHD